MMGSDWPVCTLAAGHQDVTGIVEAYFAKLTAHEQAAILGSNATSFYQLQIQ